MFELFGYIAIIFSMIGRITTRKERMRKAGMVSVSFYAMSIYSYGGINGVFVSLISLVTKGLSLTYNEEKLFWLKVLSPFIAIVFYIFVNGEGYIGILPAVGLMFVIIADLQEPEPTPSYLSEVS